MFSVRRPKAAALATILSAAEADSFTYPEVGATATTAPAGYRNDRWSCDLGADTDRGFERARAGLRDWVVQRGAGLTVFPDSPVAARETFVLVLSLPVAGFATATARVVYVVDEPDRAGFAYGTLSGHPETGEESFIVIRRDGRLVFEITAFSKASHRLARLGGPVTRRLQLQATGRYLAAMSQHCNAANIRSGAK